MDEEHVCEVYTVWKEKKRGVITFMDDMKGEVEFSVPPEFMGHHHMITPEDLFLSSILTCFDSYFFNMAKRSRLKFRSFRSCARGTLIPNGPDFIFSGITITANIDVKDEKDRRKAHRAVELSEKGCYIANSIKPKVVVKSNIKIEE
ncbi:MAG TPA: OsmC family protein [Candidatus Methanofastidiosa archaeon]|nr:OsmC family protein [Candidatus Methanofastidiosa archaeon]HPR42390.1 OsmC family protein [Candidatus Methanofastidiosa archaeon]